MSELGDLAVDIDRRSNRLEQFFSRTAKIEGDEEQFSKLQSRFDNTIDSYKDAVMNRNNDGVRQAAAGLERIEESIVESAKLEVEKGFRKLVDGMESGKQEKKVRSLYEKVRYIYEEAIDIAEHHGLNEDLHHAFGPVKRAWSLYREGLQSRDKNKMEEGLEMVEKASGNVANIIEEALEKELYKLDGELRELRSKM